MTRQVTWEGLPHATGDWQPAGLPAAGGAAAGGERPVFPRPSQQVIVNPDNSAVLSEQLAESVLFSMAAA